MIDEMIKSIMSYPNGTSLKITWEKQSLELIGTIDTVYESCNCLDEDDPNYMDYYACAMKVTKVNKASGDYDKKIGDLVEISIINCPDKIELLNDQVIWSKNAKNNYRK